MKKKNDFLIYLHEFLTTHVPLTRELSENTVATYAHSFLALFKFFAIDGVDLNKASIADMTKERIIKFLTWIREEKKLSLATKNVRLAAIHEFARFLINRTTDYALEMQKIINIKSKKAPQKIMVYLSTDATLLLLEQPDTSTPIGRRDLALFSLMYHSAARVQEMIDLKPLHLRLSGDPALLIEKGKGEKDRLVPLLDTPTSFLKEYMKENGLDLPENNSHRLFVNRDGKKFSRVGIEKRLKKYVKQAIAKNPSLYPDISEISCHTLRHSRAMHLIEAGESLEVIRDILGHEYEETTKIYARANEKMKRAAMEKVLPTNPDIKPVWREPRIVTLLKGFTKKSA